MAMRRPEYEQGETVKAPPIEVGRGEAFDELEGNDSCQLTVVRANDGCAYITISSESRRHVRFCASDAQSVDISDALRRASAR